MNPVLRKTLSVFSPLLGTGGVGVCPACVSASAALLSWLGLGLLIPIWRPIAFGLLGLGVIGFTADFFHHRKPLPLFLLLFGSGLLYVGRYVYGGPQFGGWPLWLLGMALTITAVMLNRRQFRHVRRNARGKHGSPPQGSI